MRCLFIPIGFFIILCWLLMGSCIQKSSERVKSPLFDWLNKPENVDQKNYRDTFHTNYQSFLTKKDIISAAGLLEAYGNAKDLRYEYDSFYVIQSKQFLQLYGNQISDYYKLALHYYLGSQYDFNGFMDSSSLYLEKAYAFQTKDKESIKLKGFAGIILGNQLLMKEKTEDALSQYLQNLQLFESIHDTVNKATTLLNISEVYLRMKMYDERKNYLFKSIPLCIATKDTQGLWNAYFNLARATELEQNKDSCLFYAIKTKSLFDAWSRKTDYFISNTNYIYGKALFLNQQIDSALFHFKIAKASCKDFILYIDLVTAYADVNKALEKPLNTIELKDALEQSKLKHDIVHQGQILELLAYDANFRKNYQEAYEFTRRKYKLRDSLWMQDTKIEVANLDRKYQVAKKEKTIAEQKTKISGLLFSSIGILLASMLFFVYRKRKEAQAETIRQQTFTDELLQNTEDERKRIASDLHDGVNHELLTLKNQASNGKQIESTQIEKVINEVRQVSRDLYPAMFDHIGLAASIENLCERMTQAGLFTTCEINYTLSLSKRNELQLYRIIQEALNNTLKHAKADAAKVTIDTIGKELLVEIKDNGIGFNTAEKMSSASSFGIQSLIQRARAMGGKSTIESNEEGTKLILKTPIH
ncbi:MAG: hypothetical protein KBG47_08695 [Bacteroidia bacterium]|nr:hypothetical protein [Bacteroidia bacterium]